MWFEKVLFGILEKDHCVFSDGVILAEWERKVRDNSKVGGEMLF